MTYEYSLFTSVATLMFSEFNRFIQYSKNAKICQQWLFRYVEKKLKLFEWLRRTRKHSRKHTASSLYSQRCFCHATHAQWGYRATMFNGCHFLSWDRGLVSFQLTLLTVFLCQRSQGIFLMHSNSTRCLRAAIISMKKEA